jgi:hypothetical protein
MLIKIKKNLNYLKNKKKQKVIVKIYKQKRFRCRRILNNNIYNHLDFSRRYHKRRLNYQKHYDT